MSKFKEKISEERGKCQKFRENIKNIGKMSKFSKKKNDKNGENLENLQKFDSNILTRSEESLSKAELAFSENSGSAVALTSPAGNLPRDHQLSRRACVELF